ncbi:MAG: helix-turn-helix transcriptional regulator, partial [Planctomycetes bacterium]|nr:helix-turn-helix transcriptional regulator [Planctomycetota bacterium]
AWGRPDERRALDRLLLDLFDALDAEPAGDAAPPWLRQAVASLATDRQRLALGAAALAGACRRSPAHVARCVRAAYGTTPTVLVDRLRLERAAEDLRMTAHPIARIALDAGYLTLGYFYRRFQARFRCTPRAYRRLHAEPLGG